MTAEPVVTDEPAAPSVNWTGWLTSSDYESGKPNLQKLTPVSPDGPAADATVTLLVDASTGQRRWRGVGAALTDESVALLTASPRARALLFSPTDPGGAHLNLLRLPLSATDFSKKPWTWDWDGTTASPSAQPAAMNAIGLLTGPLLGLQPGLQVLATAWSAPGTMKTENKLEGGSLRDDAATMDAYGRMLVSQARWLTGHGVPLRAMTLGNEPFIGPGHGYPTMDMSTPQMADLARAVAPALGGEDIDLWAVDHNWTHVEEYKKLLAAVPAGTFAASAFHCYSPPGEAPKPWLMHNVAGDKVMTECTGSDDGSTGTFAWDMEHLVDVAIDAGSTGLLFWNLALKPNNPPAPYGRGCPNCRGVVSVDAANPDAVKLEPEFYTLAHLARAADPGARIVGVTSSIPNVRVVAFANNDDTIGVFGYNGTASPQTVRIRVHGAGETRFTVASKQLFTMRGPAGESTNAPAVGGWIARTREAARYYIDRTGYRHHIGSEPVAACHGGEANTFDVTPATLAQYPETEPAACFTARPGDIIRHPDGDSYVLVNSSAGAIRQWIPTAADYVCARAENRIVVPVSRYHIAEITAGPDRPPRNCIVRAPGGDAHYINNEGRREWIPDSPTWDCEIGRGSTPYDVPSGFVDSVDEVGWHYCLNKSNLHGKVLRHSDGDSSYIHPDNTRTWIPDSPTWDCRQRQGKAVVDTRWREYVTAFHDSGWDYCFDPAVFRGKVLRHADGDGHYIHPDDTKTWIPDGATWACRMAQGKSVVETRWREYVNRFSGSEWDYCYDVNTMKNRIVSHPDGDSHFVDDAGKRHWISSQATYNCLRSRGIATDTVRWRDYINRIPEGEWAVCGDSIATNQKLDRGQWLRSGDGRYRLQMQTDGNLVAYNSAGRAIWATNRTGAFAVVQSDGNLVEYAGGGTAVWASNTAGSGANRLVMQSDGNLVLYAGSRAVWASNTVGR